MTERQPNRTDGRARGVGGAKPEAGPPAPRRYRPNGRAPLVRVVVWLDAAALEDLELLARYRHGGQSRSAVVRGAVDWLRAKEAAWLMRSRRQHELRAQEAAELAQALSAPERERLEAEALLDAAIDVIRRHGEHA
ncbi:MAG TPA: hypothetical protein VG325_00545 [Solirubrobacteraceae bacterium]|jgi:hypothetical protein|nr:hypothetical protein [Solirubrobacteraceae bacterium]